MPEQLITQRLDRALGGFSGVEAGKKAEYTGQHRCHQHCGSCKQQDTFDIALHQTVQTQSLKPSRHLPAADNRVYGHADNLWGQRVTRGIEHRANQSQCKQPQTATYKAKHQLYRIFSFILLQTNHSPFDNSFSPLQAFFSLPPFLLSQTDNEHSFPRVRSYLLKQKIKKAPLLIKTGMLLRKNTADHLCGPIQSDRSTHFATETQSTALAHLRRKHTLIIALSVPFHSYDHCHAIRLL